MNQFHQVYANGLFSNRAYSSKTNQVCFSFLFTACNLKKKIIIKKLSYVLFTFELIFFLVNIFYFFND